MFALEVKDLEKFIVWRIQGNINKKRVFGSKRECFGSIMRFCLFSAIFPQGHKTVICMIYILKYHPERLTFSVGMIPSLSEFNGVY